MVTKFDEIYKYINIPFLTIMMQNWTNNYYKNEADYKFQKIYTNTINAYVYVGKIS